MMAFLKSLTSLLILWAKQANALPCTITWDTTTPPEYYILKETGAPIILNNWGYSSVACPTGNWLIHTFTYDSTTWNYMDGAPNWIGFQASTLASSSMSSITIASS